MRTAGERAHASECDKNSFETSIERPQRCARAQLQALCAELLKIAAVMIESSRLDGRANASSHLHAGSRRLDDR